MQPSGREMSGGDGAGGPQADDFFDQMLSTLPSAWADLGGGKSPWEQLSAGGAAEDHHSAQAPFGDESVLLATRLRQHQIGGDKSSSPVMLQLSDLHRNGGLAAGGGDEEGGGGFSPLPLFTDRSAPAREEMEGGFSKSPNATVRSACRRCRRYTALGSSPTIVLNFCSSFRGRALQGGDHAVFNGFGMHGATAMQQQFGQVIKATRSR
jgi:hypothetical protein